MFCQQCGKSNQGNARFCDSCGAPLQPVPVQQPPPPAYQPVEPVYQQPVYPPAPPVQQPPPPPYQPAEPVYQQPAYPQAPPVQQFAPRGESRSPGIAGVLSLVCSGLGQLYNGETLKGVGLFIGFIIASAIFNILGFIVVGYAIYDAFTTAKKINEGLVPFSGKSVLFWPVVILYIILIIIVILVFGLLASGIGASGYSGY
jgi:hypothetical protein